MDRVAALLVFAVFFMAGTSFALTADEVELLRRAGVSEERIQQMAGEASGEQATGGDALEPDEAAAGDVTDTVPNTALEPSFSITDWNEDGLNDIIAGTNSGEINIYINEGSNQSPEYDDFETLEDGEVDAGSVSVPCVVDWNNDGLKDILLGNRRGTVHVYLNRGTNSAPAFGRGTELMYGEVDSGSYSAPAVVDWNGDAKKDLILGDYNGRLNIYINVGSDEDPRFNEDPEEMRAELFNFSTFNYTTPFAVKNYSNGLFDILTGCGDGRVYRFRNAGTKGSPRFQTPQHIMVNDFIFELRGNTNVIAVDWDKDGLEDLMVSNRTTTQTQGSSSVNEFSSAKTVDKVHSKVYFLKNVGTNEEPRYDRAVEILKDSRDISL